MTAKLADGFIASDQTGAYPHISHRGYKYICVFCICDANRIKGIVIKLRHASELLLAYQEVYKWCKTRGFKPELHRMDNETSSEVEEFIASQRTDLQYSPPGRHCAPAEKAVQTYKSCFKSTTASLPSTFPISYWCHLFEQMDLEVNIVRPCRQNLKLSAWAATEGEFHFGSTPIAPPGTELLMYVRPENRRRFGHNANKAWYVGPYLKHCHKYVQRHIIVDGQGQDGGYSKNEVSCHCNTKANAGGQNLGGGTAAGQGNQTTSQGRSNGRASGHI